MSCNPVSYKRKKTTTISRTSLQTLENTSNPIGK